MSTVDPAADFRRKRAGKKSVVTKKINQIKALIDGNENIDLTEALSKKLQEAKVETEKCHEV